VINRFEVIGESSGRLDHSTVLLFRRNEFFLGGFYEKRQNGRSGTAARQLLLQCRRVADVGDDQIVLAGAKRLVQLVSLIDCFDLVSGQRQAGLKLFVLDDAVFSDLIDQNRSGLPGLLRLEYADSARHRQKLVAARLHMAS
jgi:hypothetical protein